MLNEVFTKVIIKGLCNKEFRKDWIKALTFMLRRIGAFPYMIGKVQNSKNEMLKKILFYNLGLKKTLRM